MHLPGGFLRLKSFVSASFAGSTGAVGALLQFVGRREIKLADAPLARARFFDLVRDTWRCTLQVTRRIPLLRKSQARRAVPRA